MKKGIFCILILSMFLYACKDTKHSKEQTKTYNSFKESLLGNGSLISSDIPFQYSIKITEENGKYKYTVVVDKPQIVMNSIQFMILNPDDLSENYETPTMGIFSESEINMVPNQSNNGSGYVNKLELSGISKQENFIIYATLAWKDSDQLTQYQVYFSFDIIEGKNTKEGIVYE